MAEQPLSDDLLGKLAGYDTPTICNALEVLDPERCGFGFTRRPLISSIAAPAPRVGYARTARIRTTRPQGLSGETRAARNKAYYDYVADGAGPKIALYQDMDGDAGIAACWGDVMATMHQGMGFVGVVTNGAIRDIAGMPDDYLLLASCVKPLHGHLHYIDHGGEVDIAGMVANNGDLIHMDRNGAVVIPDTFAADLPAAAEQIIGQEETIKSAARKRPFDMDALRAAQARH